MKQHPPHTTPTDPLFHTQSSTDLPIDVGAIRADTGTAVIDANIVQFARPDDSGLAAVVNSFRANGGTQYEGPLQVAANWLREDVDPGDGMTERHEDSQNFIFFFSDGGEVYLPPASLVADLYDNGSGAPNIRSEEHTSELQSLMRISYAV